MDRLHRRDDAKLAEAGNIGSAEVLRVLHAPAQILAVAVVLPERGLVDVQHLAIGAIANGVDAQLHAVIDRDLRGLGQRLNGRRHESGALGLVAVRLEQPRAARTERAIGAGGNALQGLPPATSAPSATTLIARTVNMLLP